MEIWKDIKGYEGLYQVSDQGRVRSLDRKSSDHRGPKDLKGVILSLTKEKRKRGYQVAGLFKDGRRRSISVHVLVAESFIPNPEGLPQVDHKDGVKWNNVKSNLQWIDNQGNSERALAKHYTFISPQGEVVGVFNLSAFCRDQGLDTSAMLKVHKGRANHHKGWKAS